MLNAGTSSSCVRLSRVWVPRVSAATRSFNVIEGGINATNQRCADLDSCCGNDLSRALTAVTFVAIPPFLLWTHPSILYFPIPIPFFLHLHFAFQTWHPWLFLSQLTPSLTPVYLTLHPCLFWLQVHFNPLPLFVWTATHDSYHRNSSSTRYPYNIT